MASLRRKCYLLGSKAQGDLASDKFGSWFSRNSILIMMQSKVMQAIIDAKGQKPNTDAVLSVFFS